ncbi:[SSU ribosomal protein S18P]-alanine acetyltransferase [Melaminivora alkalimesophila]|uniref:[Ribosomal protein bS18]-alanine N-acetyltransferase n=2 Tax=Melaminivora alkalimesophila TaxID=1165852 RepID=A0A317RCE9_9BURK|nr:ribosomal protein S18-alanine N-acetyltransferase [Melaminivora alkalimesophila]PWW46753.1 [SSU ribosomal protein S18P]-alanine acetyltransferase [Melaminivora alkalimesophila]
MPRRAASPPLHFEPLTPARLDLLMAVEQSAYAQPWSRANFVDSMTAGYECRLLLAGPDDLLGYFVAMRGVEEAHLLNLTVAPRHQRQGWAAVLLDALDLWARGQGARWLWLEVRASNLRAQSVYQAHGYRRVGERKGYYPAPGGQREDAIVMSLPL